MNLFQKLLSKKDQSKYFLILIIRQETIYAKIIQVDKENVTIIGSGQSKFVPGKDETDAADIAVSAAEKDLPENILTEDVIFALPPDYIDAEKGDIKPDYQERLKKISHDLGLTVRGFVEYHQALVSYLQIKEEAPTSAILIGVYKNQLVISLVRVGKIKKSIFLPRIADLTSDFEKAFNQFSVEILPSRIIFFDGEKPIEDLRGQLLKYPWHKHSSFLHTPKIEIINSKEINEAIVISVGNSFFDQSNLILRQGQIESDTISKQNTVKKKKDRQDFGFVKEQDIAETIIEKEEAKIEQKEKTYQETEQVDAREGKYYLLTTRIASLLKFKKLSLPNMSLFSSLPVFWIAIFTILLVFLSSIYWFYPQADVFLIVYPSTSSKQVDVVFTTSSDSNPSQNIIQAQMTEAEVKGEKSISTTGTTKVGKPASGKIVFYNKTFDSKTFPKGTILQNGQLTFTLDEEIRVASASDTGESIEFGKGEVNVTAATIGPEGNLPENSTFVLKDFPQAQYSAKNTDKFSGGSSREISTVSKQDQENILSQLSEELIASGRQKLIESLSSGQRLIESSITTSEKNKQFSHQPGDETREVTLNLTLTVSLLSYKNPDLDQIANEVNLTIPEGFIIESKKTNITNYQFSQEDKESIKATANITILSRPEIDLNNLKARLKGKTYSDASKLLAEIAYIGGVEIIDKKNLPLFNNRLPLNGNNIEIKVKSKNQF